MDRILVVGAHAMDAEVMAGAIGIKAVEKGIPVLLAHLTRGERGHKRKAAEVFGKQLEQEMADAARVMQVRQQWAGFMAPLSDSDSVVEWLEEIMTRERITRVLTHWIGSWHASHVRAHKAVVAAIDHMGANPPALFYAENCEDLTGFQPDWFVPIEEVYDRWMMALNCYELFRMSLGRAENEGSIPYFAYYSSITQVRGRYVNAGRVQALMCGKGELPAVLGGLRNPPVEQGN